MKEDRRNFLIKMGAAALFGAGASAAVGQQLSQTVFADSGEREAGQTIRYGMFVDMSKCTDGCDKCMTACHTKHNVPNIGNRKDGIRWIWKDDYEKVFTSKSQEFQAEQAKDKPVLAFCNHCAQPPCVKVCPTKATFKRKDGIVEMDFHRCIGCRFCMAACPYGARSFNWRNPREFLSAVDYNYPTREIGVVEKCNFCSERLHKKQQPACVESCPEKALTFGNLYDKQSEIRSILRRRVTFTRKPELGTQPSVFYAFEDGGAGKTSG